MPQIQSNDYLLYHMYVQGTHTILTQGYYGPDVLAIKESIRL